MSAGAGAGTPQLQTGGALKNVHAPGSPNAAKGTSGGALLEDSKEGADALPPTSCHGPMSAGQARKNSARGGVVRAAAKKREFVRRLVKPLKRALCLFYIWPSKRVQQNRAEANATLSSFFFAIPTELQLEVILNLSLQDIIHLRQTSWAFAHLIQDHEAHIVKQYLKKRMPKDISLLFPLPTTSQPSLRFLQDLTYRQTVSDELALLLARRIVKEMGHGHRLRQSEINLKLIQYVIGQLQIAFSPLILAVFHFFETYHSRIAHTKDASSSSEPRGIPQPSKNREIQAAIMLQYPDDLLLKIHQMYHLLLHLFTRRLTPTTPWFLPRQIGGWNHTHLGGLQPSDDSLSKLLVFGGVPEVLRIYKMTGHGKRRKALEKFVRTLDHEKTGVTGEQSNGGTVNTRASMHIDQLEDIWVPVAEAQLLGRGVVSNLESIKCCGEFVSQLLGDEFSSSVDEGSLADASENGDDVSNSAQILANINFSGLHLRLADDGIWDHDLIEEEDDLDEDSEEIESKGPHHYKSAPRSPSPVAGPSKSPGTIVGMTAPVPLCSGIGYNGMGATFMTMSM